MMKKILIVDDDQLVRDLFVAVLEADGYATYVASNGLEGLREFYENRPDLVVSDMTMPLMEGSEFCRILRAMRDVPIILISGAEGPDLRRKMLSPHVDLFLGKPIKLEDLKAAVPRLLQVHSAASHIDSQSLEYIDTIGGPREKTEVEHLGFVKRAADESDF